MRGGANSLETRHFRRGKNRQSIWRHLQRNPCACVQNLRLKIVPAAGERGDVFALVNVRAPEQKAIVRYRLGARSCHSRVEHSEPSADTRQQRAQGIHITHDFHVKNAVSLVPRSVDQVTPARPPPTGIGQGMPQRFDVGTRTRIDQYLYLYCVRRMKISAPGLSARINL